MMDGSGDSPLPTYPTLPPQPPPEIPLPLADSTAPPLPSHVTHTTPTASSMSLPAIPQVRPVVSKPDLATASLGSARSLSRGTEGGNLVLRMQYLESLCGNLQREKRAMEEEFGRQRKKFMNNMIEKEGELNLAKQSEEKLSMEVRELSTQLLARDEELNHLKMTAKLSDSYLQERFDVERVKYEEEIALLRGKIEAQVRKHREALESERSSWRRERNSLQEELGRLRGVVSSKVKLNLQSPTDSLEASMKKAEEDTQLLRSVVVPLEKEIAELKKRLREAQQGLTSERRSNDLIDLEVSPLTPGQLDRGPSPIPTDGGMLQHLLEQERAACHDLEMHTKELKAQLEKMTQEATAQHAAREELKQTWELANQHFIVSQDKLKQEIYRLQQRLKEEGIDQPATEEDEGGAEKEGEEGRIPSSLLRSQSSENLAVEPLTLQAASAGRSASWSNLLQNMPQDSEELSKRVKSLEAELVRVQGELSRRQTICEGYESQLQRVQEQMVMEMDDKERMMDRLRAENEKFKAGIMREQRLRQDLHRQMEETKEEMKARIESFQNNEREVSQSLRVVRESFTEAKHEAQREVARFSEERARLHGQISSSQEEYDCLKVVQSQQISEHQQRLTDATTARREAEFNVATLTEKLTQLQQQMTEREDSLCGEVTQLKEELMGERTRAEKLVRTLETTKAELAGVQEELERERKAKEEAVTGRQAIQEKSKTFIAEQHQEMERLNQAKEGAEQQVRDLLRQIASLKSRLDSTEATQKDFVQLSQSLQVRLAEIEEERQAHIGSSPEHAPS